MSSFPPAPSKRIAIVGSAGRLGRLLSDSLEKSHNVIRLAREQLDISCERSIRAALEPLDYDLLIITGALTAVDYCETHSDEAYSINAEAPGKIADISARKGAHVTFFSTDFVYDGSKSGLYSEMDPALPISVYGASKLQGEELVLAASAANLVIRVSWLFGPGKAAFPEWIINRACVESELTLPGDKIGCPTSTIDLVKFMSPLLFGCDRKPAAGVFNLSNSQPCTWQEWGQYCIDTARNAGLPVLAGEIAPVALDSVPAFVAKRPANSAMDTSKFTAFTGITPGSWQNAVSDFLHQSDLFRNSPASA